MGFRTLEICRACEIHIKEGQLEIASEEKIQEDIEFHKKYNYPYEDILLVQHDYD